MVASNAKVLSNSILARLEEADEDLGRFIKISGWAECGYETFTEWWTAMALPVIEKLMYVNISLKAEVRDVVLSQVRAEDTTKPRPQRHTQKELAALVGVHEDTVQKALKIAPSRPAPVVPDLDRSNKTDKVNWPEAEDMARQGSSFAEIGRRFGVDESTVRRDVGVRQAKAECDPALDVEGSQRHYDKTVACDIEPAPVLIKEVDQLLQRLLSKVYTLSKVDKRRLMVMMTKALRELESK